MNTAYQLFSEIPMHPQTLLNESKSLMKTVKNKNKALVAWIKHCWTFLRSETESVELCLSPPSQKGKEFLFMTNDPISCWTYFGICVASYQRVFRLFFLLFGVFIVLSTA